MTASSPRIAVVTGEGGGIHQDLPQLLARLGVQFERISSVTVKDGQIEQLNYNIYLVEDNLPSIDVVALMSVLASKKRNSEVLVVSASQNLERALECMRAGASDYVFAPFDELIIRRALDRIISSAMNTGIIGIKDISHRYLLRENASYQLSSEELSKIRFNLEIVNHLQDNGKIDSKTRLQLELAFQEALTNSLDHGNLELISEWKEEITESGLDRYELTRRERILDPKYSKRLIVITTEYDGCQLRISIKDQGKGFDVEKQRQKAFAELECHGRGLPIMDRVLDQLNYSANGTEVTLIKNLSQTVDALG